MRVVILSSEYYEREGMSSAGSTVRSVAAMLDSGASEFTVSMGSGDNVMLKLESL